MKISTEKQDLGGSVFLTKTPENKHTFFLFLCIDIYRTRAYNDIGSETNYLEPELIQ